MILKYINDIYSYTSEQIANENLILFHADREKFDKIKNICYKPILALDMYNDAIAAGYQPLIDATKEALERSVEDVKLLYYQPTK